MKSILFTLISVFILNLFGWNSGFCQDKSSFEKIFDKEDNAKLSRGFKKFKNISSFSYYPDTLPGWFFKLPASNNGSLFAIGISDPDMLPDKAKIQAFHRAKIVASLCSKSKLQYFRDIYTTEQQEGRYTNYRQRFDTYFKISTLAEFEDDNFAVVDTHFTRYNEYVMLVKYTPSENETCKKFISAIGTVLFIEAQVKDAFEVQAEYEVKSSIKSLDALEQESHYLYREKGNKFLTSSTFMGSVVEFPVYIYRYASPEWKGNIIPLTSYNGLWSKFTQELLRYLTLTTEESRKRIKNLNQQYSPENENLSREVASLAASLNMNGIDFARDTIKFNILVREDYAKIK